MVLDNPCTVTILSNLLLTALTKSSIIPSERLDSEQPINTQ
ncbi:hypothetical protein ACSXD4_16425 (plasmid) [Clostridium perfringens]